jgi:mitochondrial fission protein ELM1
MGDLAESLVALARHHGAGLMVTPSRRTGADNEAILRARMREVPSVVWDGQGENPYFGFLGLADAIIVTCDSVSMISEACSTGKPVYLVALEGESARFRKFHEALLRAGMVRRFEDRTDDGLDHWSYPPLDDTRMVAAEVRRRLAARGVVL